MAGNTSSRIERGFLALVLSLALSAWVAVLLAEVGLLTPALFAAAAVGATTLAIAAIRRVVGPRRKDEPSPGPAGSAVGGTRQGLAAVGVAVLCAMIFFPPYETFVWASDSTVYLSLGAEISRNDGFELHDPLLAEIDVPTRAEIFRNPAGLDATGLHARLPGGFAIPDIEAPTVVAGFSPVFPALLAVVYDFGGARAMPWVAPALATLGMVALFLLGCRVSGTTAGIGATGLAAVAMPQIWFAKFPMPEILAELFVLAALLALSMSLADDQPLWGGMAGGLLGIAALGKFELLPIVAITLTTFVGAQLLLTGRGPRQAYLWMAGAFAMLSANAILHYLLLPTHYTLFIRQQVSSNYAVRMVQGFGWGRFALVVGLIGIAAIIASTRVGGGLRALLARPRWWGSAMLLAVGVYFLNDAGPSDVVSNPVGLPADIAETIGWLRWYLPPPFGLTLALASVAAIGLAWRQRKATAVPRDGSPVANAPAAADVSTSTNERFPEPAAPTAAAWEALAFVVVLVLISCLHLYRAPDTNEHIWTMRRFVPVVLPGLAVLTATLTATALRHLGPRRGTFATAVVLSGLTAIVAIPSLPTFGQPLWRGSFRVGSDIAALVPEGSIVLLSADLAGTHLATTLNYIHDVRTIVLRPTPPDLLGGLIAGWIEGDRPVSVITGGQVLSFYAPHLSLVELHRKVLTVPVLERTRDRPPRRIVSEEAPLTVARLFPRADAVTVIDIGNPADDMFFQLFGFHGRESDPGPSGAAFRWTTASSRFMIPPARAVKLTLAGARPDGVPAAHVWVSVDGVLVLEDFEVPNEPTEILVDLPDRPDSPLPGEFRTEAASPVSTAPRSLVLLSTAFRPAQAGTPNDERSLGVRLYQVELIASPTDTGASGERQE